MKKSSLISDKDGWRTVSTDTVYKDKNVEVTRQTVFTPTRQDKPAEWTVVHRKAAVVIAPMTPEGKLVLVHQERIPVRALMWEFPAGQIDEENSDDENIVRETAVRELQEETGYQLPADVAMIALGYFFHFPGVYRRTQPLVSSQGRRVVEGGRGARRERGHHGLPGVHARRIPADDRGKQDQQREYPEPLRPALRARPRLTESIPLSGLPT